MRIFKQWLLLLMAAYLLCSVTTPGFTAETDDAVQDGILKNFENLHPYPDLPTMRKK